MIGGLSAVIRACRIDSNNTQSNDDISDALEGVVYGISRRTDVWNRWGINPYEKASRFVKMVGEDN